MNQDTYSNIEKVTLESVANFQNGHAFYKDGYSDEGYLAIDLFNISEDGRLRFGDRDKYVSKQLAEKYSRFILNKDNLVIVMTDMTQEMGILGKAAIIDCDDKYILNQRIGRLTHNRDKIDLHYLYYFINSDFFLRPLRSLAKGAVQKYVNTGDIKNNLVYLHNLKSQRIIGRILRQFDELIEINEARIILLEAISKLIYREWFLEFRFPQYENYKFVPSGLGRIPEGWALSSVSDIAQISRGISYRSDNLVEVGIPFFTINSLYRNGGFKLDGLKYYEGNYKESRIVKPNEIIIGVTDMTQARLIVGSVARIPSSGIGDGLISMDLVKAKAKIGYSNEYVYSMLRYSEFTRTVKEFANGANVLHLNPKHIENFQFVLPDKNVREQFVDVISPIYQLMDNLVQNNVILTKTKELLLPKLMSGEIDVSKLDIEAIEN